MIKKVTLVLGAGNYSRKWGYSAHERYVIETAKVTEASPCYYLIEGKARVYKGVKSKTFLREDYVKQKIKKKAGYLTIEEANTTLDYIVNDSTDLHEED